ncbi:hypothetical protein [Bacillus sp. FJAT-22090]|uniref:hypothetical protein n=1 Tax=Bacillus sp. FJAT-22090 TaxID=1581038 RepID=UPI0011A39B62|nr:hypothetical protein [Bacillus sp. FJAT-22090]
MNQTFILTEDHLTLLSNLLITWNQTSNIYGSVAIDGAQPYGSTDILSSIYELIEGKKIDADELMRQLRLDYEELSTELYKKYQGIHRETETALQIVLNTRSFETGKYNKNSDGNWKRVGD